MQRYFTEIKENNVFILNKDDTYHITKVMRMKIGDNIEVVYDKLSYIAEIVDIKDQVKAKILSLSNENNELDNEIILVQSLVKEQKMDFILQKNTELGVSKIIPYKAIRSVVKDNDKEQKKIERWNKITKEASEQSKRNIIPIVTRPIDLNELEKISKDINIKILCTVNEKSINLKKVISDIKNQDKVMIVIGPEGGFTCDEENKLINCGFVPTSLGKSVLRTETASIFILSSIRYQNMR